MGVLFVRLKAWAFVLNNLNDKDNQIGSFSVCKMNHRRKSIDLKNKNSDEASRSLNKKFSGVKKINHKGTKMLETQRLILRQFCKSDIEYAYKNWTSDDSVTKYLRWQTHNNIFITQKIISDWILLYKNLDFYQWAVVLKTINEPIGSISAVELNEKINSVEIGYCIGHKWWNKGLTSEAFMKVIKFFFDEVKVNRIQARHDFNNFISGKVMQKCGLQPEGILKQADINNQGIIDVCIYGLVRDDYKKLFYK